MAQKKACICILVTCSPLSESSHTLFELARAARQAGHQVQLFLMADGVYHIQQAKFQRLIELGVEVALCASNALERGVAERAGVLFGSQYDLATMAARSDTFFTLN